MKFISWWGLGKNDRPLICAKLLNVELLSFPFPHEHHIIFGWVDDNDRNPAHWFAWGFSSKPLDPKFLDKPKWLSTKFQITLWCEHSRMPLPLLNPDHPKQGVYEIDIPREWFVKSAPWLKIMTTTLSLVLPVASSAIKLEFDDTTYKGFEEQIDFGQKTLEMARPDVLH